jgi:membrane protein YdbS with pleckstrin-like domain
MNPLSPLVKTIWTVHFLVATVVLALSLFLVEAYLRARDHLPWIFASIPPFTVTVVCTILGIIASIIVPQLRYYYWRFDVREHEIHIVRGILTRRHTVAPIARVQHLDVAQGVIERIVGIGSLVLYTAGTRGADVVIPGLPIEYAEALRDYLKSLLRDDAGTV